jgi:two-component system KDP operon response regulator KdpE
MDSPVALDPHSLVATTAARRAKLTRREFAVLARLCDGGGTVVATGRLLDAVWGPNTPVANLRVAIGGLRRKLEADPQLPTLIVTVPGEGYRLGKV